MCLAIYKPAHKPLKADAIENGWQHNPGGGGFCYVKKGKIVVEKGFFKLEDMKTALDTALKRNKASPFLIHFRIPTFGDRSASNTHPFMFEHGAGMHNGSMHGTGAVSGQGPSDTNLFFAKFGKEMTQEKLTAIKDKLETALGYNKIVVLYPNRQAIILNEKEGVWDDGVWYSNNTYKSRGYYTGSH